ncbi:hypothetical protein JB92DRAFT_3104298 [Gautieria morchelliformis]|nr:hypothetical protein JB92DRAFT_3104298 [Gautieria morchelliformis]
MTLSTCSSPTTPNGFEPSIHLAPHYQSPPVIKMDELGYNATADSDIAATKPFPLFTLDAVRRIRGELFDHNTLADHLYSDTLSPSVVRGVCPERARFIYEAWTHPAVVERLNDAAGIALTPVYDYEIGHVNLQLGPRGWAGLTADPDLPDSVGSLATDEEITPTLMRKPNWHKDSYPFVCILMLSESSHLQGGRTVVRRADGSEMFCDLPPIGHAMILQGGHIEHAVSPTDSTQERVSMVTSFRPINPLARDICELTTVRTVSDVPTLHKQWCQYRMKVLALRAEAMAAKLEDKNLEGIEEEMGKFVKEQGEFLAHTWGEMIKPVASVRTDTRATFLTWKANRQTSQAQV